MQSALALTSASDCPGVIVALSRIRCSLSHRIRKRKTAIARKYSEMHPTTAARIISAKMKNEMALFVSLIPKEGILSYMTYLFSNTNHTACLGCLYYAKNSGIRLCAVVFLYFPRAILRIPSMSQGLADSLRHSLINTQYNMALRDPLKSVYIKKFQLQQCDENLLWIVDNLIAPTAPQDDTRQAFELFYYTLLANLQKASRQMQYNSLEFCFTQKPPAVIRDIIAMCAYLQIDIYSPFVWLAMTAMSLGTPLGWVFENEYYKNVKTGETLMIHPADMILYQWKDRKIVYAGTQLIMRLSEEEQAKVGLSFIVVYDFKELKTKFIGKHDLFYPDLIGIYLTDEDIVNQQINEHIELAGALIEANEVVFYGAQGDVALLHNRGVDSEVDTIMQTYQILQEQNKNKVQAKYVKQQGYERYRKTDCQQNHYLLKFQQSLLPDIQLTYEFAKYKLLPAPIDLARFISYSCVSKRYYSLIVQNQTPIHSDFMTPVRSAGEEVQMRLIVNVSQKAIDDSRFVLNSTLSLGNVLIFNELNGFPYPFEAKNEAVPRLYDFMIGKPVSCRGVVFVIKYMDLASRRWFRQCGRIIVRLSRLIGCSEDFGAEVSAGRMCVSAALDRLIKAFYQARASGKEIHAGELVEVAEALISTELALTM